MKYSGSKTDHSRKKTEDRTKAARVQPAEYRRYILFLFPFAAAFFVLWYVKNSSCDVVYSDYIRLVNSYLPDALAPETFLTPDILSRIPFTYLARWINVKLFSYSLTFDRILGILGILMMSLMLCRYLIRVRLSLVWAFLLTVFAFSLNKWEMLLNGSGYAHMISFGFFFWQYLILERVYTGTALRYDRLLLCILPWIITLLLAGPYCAVYTVALLLAYVFMWGSRNQNVEKKELLLWMLCTFLPLLLYIWSDSYAVYEHAGAKDITLLEALTEETLFFPEFLLNGLASTVLGGETIQNLMQKGILTEGLVYGIGVLSACAYLSAVWFILRFRLYRESIFPLLLVVSGMGNHAVVMLGRYIFLDPTYAWASRYALQYQAGVIGIVLVYALTWKKLRNRKKGRTEKAVSLLIILGFTVMFTAGNMYTSWQELTKMQAREDNYEAMAQAALQYRTLDDQMLADRFEYRKGAQDIRDAFALLEENHLNVFR